MKKKQPYVSLVHFGCARCVIDSELMIGRVTAAGVVITDDASAAHTIARAADASR